MTLQTFFRSCCVLLGLGLIISASGRPAEAAVPPPPATAQGPTDLNWSPPRNVSASFTVDSEAPALTVTESGIVHAVWEEEDELYHSHRTEEAWSIPSRIHGTGDGQQPALASGPGEKVHLVYVNDSDVLYVSWNGSTWGLPRNVSQTAGISDSPDVAVAPDGTIHVVAIEQVGEDELLYHASSEDGSDWPAYTPIPSAYGQSPSIDVTGTPTVTVQIAYREALPADIYTLKRVGDTWTVPEAVASTPETFSTAPELALDDSGEAHVAWRETIDSTPQVQYARGPIWTPVITLSQSSTGTTLPSLALDSRGRVHAAWGDGAYPSFTLVHTWSGDTTSWQPPRPTDTSSMQLDDVALVGATNGTVHAVWVEGGTGEVWYASWPHYRVYLPFALKE